MRAKLDPGKGMAASVFAEGDSAVIISRLTYDRDFILSGEIHIRKKSKVSWD